MRAFHKDRRGGPRCDARPRGADRDRDRRQGGLVGLAFVLGDHRSPAEAKVQVEGAALRIGVAASRGGMRRSAASRGRFRAPLDSAPV
ncbi:MAG: hypothetical protein AVDCRST_MAG08-2255 [uncultured Acetobacteraceae bacterium]|uniref:Uncharacterized protein n=1 Tax=uncultured Acetobacteraceae bacterium TaxID=169975 RepID=A0A6J4IK07_9PROT|nr:MAG: hypothetical protein AVDCRST_MAG08-2255 [uncultured Acetobacteraceae bacterium]